MAGSSLLQSSDLHIFGARFDDSPSSRSTTLSWDARFALDAAAATSALVAAEVLTAHRNGELVAVYAYLAFGFRQPV